MDTMKQPHMAMPPEARGALARNHFLAGYGCAQAVLLAFEDLTGLDREMAARLASSFGGGMGRMREVCGAVSGALMVLGLLSGYSEPADTAGKSRHYADVRAFAARFRERCLAGGRAGSIVCRELLASAHVPSEAGGEAEARTPEYYRKRPCPDLCAIAASMVAEMLAEAGNQA